jgi:hypothetical protein
VTAVAVTGLFVALAGCGGTGRPPLETCLSGEDFLVQQTGQVVEGSSAGGVNFTLTVYASPAAARRALAGKKTKSAAVIGSAVVDFSGNPPPYPGGASAKLAKSALATIRSCLTHA